MLNLLEYPQEMRIEPKIQRLYLNGTTTTLSNIHRANPSNPTHSKPPLL